MINAPTINMQFIELKVGTDGHAQILLMFNVLCCLWPMYLPGEVGRCACHCVSITC